MLGNILRGREQQYVAHKDEKTATWRILDTWHEKLTQLGPEDEIEDDNEAVTILTEGGFIALVQEAARLGVLANAQFDNNSEEYDLQLEEKDRQIRELRDQLQTKRDIPNVPIRPDYSEEYALKEKALESILKLAAMSDMTKITDKD